jgi:hypothetical protein
MDERERRGRDRSETFSEEIEIGGSQLIEWVRHLLMEGNVRQIRIKAPGGQILLEAPATAGARGGGAEALASPWLAIVGALAATVSRVPIEIVRMDVSPEEELGRLWDEGGGTSDA